MLSSTIQLFKKELILEWRNKYALNGILLYLSSTIFIIYLSIQLKAGEISNPTWNALFWIIILFTAVNAVAKSFIQESEGRQLYLYQIAKPSSIIISKLIYNSLLMLLLVALGFILYSIVLNNPVENLPEFITLLVLSAISFSSSFTLLSGIAAKAGKNAILMSILSFPVVLPILLLIIKLSLSFIEGGTFEDSQNELLTLFAVDAILVASSLILFPFLWKS